MNHKPANRLKKLLTLFGLTLLVSGGNLFAQAIFFSFNENGLGNVTANGVNGPVPFTVAPDPSGGLPTNVLQYTLPFLVAPGDVGLAEPGQSSASDLLRFFNPAGGNQTILIFYSDVEAAGGGPVDLADTGLPLSPNAIIIPEVGPEAGGNGAFWFPAVGQPGSGPPGGAPIQYQFISDVPEPGSAVLLLAGVGIFCVVNGFRRRDKSN